MIFLKNTTQLAKRNIFMKNGNEARVVAGDSNKRCRDARQRQENPDRIKNHKDCTICYRALLEKQMINTVLSGKVFGEKRVRSASDNLERYCGQLSDHGSTTSGFQGNLKKCHFKDETSWVVTLKTEFKFENA